MSSIQEAIVKMCLPEVTHHASNEPHKEDTMEYPEEIYATLDGGRLTDHLRNAEAGWGRRLAYQVGKVEQTDPFEGYSNLTEAIRTGKPIYWERMEGVKVKCANRSIGTLRGELKRNTAWGENGVAGWYRRDMDYSYVNAFVSAWNGEDGWTLWVEGEIPLIRKTADQLEPGTEFHGVLKNSEPDGVAPELMLRTQGHVLHLDDYTISQLSPRHFEVVKVVGAYDTFQKPEGK